MANLIESLPNEIKRSLLEHTPDFDTLVRFIVASRAFNSVYKQSKEHILGVVLQNYIHPAVYPEAYVLRRTTKRTEAEEHYLLYEIERWRDEASLRGPPSRVA